jgi:hypothetical protein
VVPESSATLGYPREATIALNGDHSSIVKYLSDTDDNYKVVSETLSLMLQDAKKNLQGHENTTSELTM